VQRHPEQQHQRPHGPGAGPALPEPGQYQQPGAGPVIHGPQGRQHPHRPAQHQRRPDRPGQPPGTDPDPPPLGLGHACQHLQAVVPTARRQRLQVTLHARCRSGRNGATRAATNATTASKLAAGGGPAGRGNSPNNPGHPPSSGPCDPAPPTLSSLHCKLARLGDPSLKHGPATTLGTEGGVFSP